MNQISVTMTDKEIKEIKKLSREIGLSMSKIVSLRMRGYEIVKRTVAPDQQEPEKPDDDLEETRNQWLEKNQQRILEAWGKSEPNWHNILVKNPELGFRNPRELKNWILGLGKVSPTRGSTGAGAEHKAGEGTAGSRQRRDTGLPPQ